MHQFERVIMKTNRSLILSLGVILVGAQSLSGTTVRADEGECVWNLQTSRDCFEYNLIEECEYHVQNECHSPNWHVYSAQCSGQTISCTANWQES